MAKCFSLSYLYQRLTSFLLKYHINQHKKDRIKTMQMILTAILFLSGKINNKKWFFFFSWNWKADLINHKSFDLSHSSHHEHLLLLQWAWVEVLQSRRPLISFTWPFHPLSRVSTASSCFTSEENAPHQRASLESVPALYTAALPWTWLHLSGRGGAVTVGVSSD